MKRIIAKMLAVVMTVALFSTTTLAYNDKGAYTGIGDTGVGTASIAAAISLTIDGTTYSIPGGAVSTVGYTYQNNYTYVKICQQACNQLVKIHEDDIIGWNNCYCGEVDGIFGEKTYNGILGFQETNNLFRLVAGWPKLVEDGVCGDNTWKQLAVICW